MLNWWTATRLQPYLSARLVLSNGPLKRKPRWQLQEAVVSQKLQLKTSLSSETDRLHHLIIDTLQIAEFGLRSDEDHIEYAFRTLHGQ